MSGLLLAFTLAAVGAEVSSSTAKATAEQAVKLRRFDDYSNAIDEALRAESRPGDQHQRGTAIRHMTSLYRELARDPRFESSDTLKSYKAKLWSRLTRVKKELQKQVDREAKLADSKVDANEVRAVQEASRSLADQVSTMNYTMGGPGYVFSQTGGAGGGGTTQDYGEELIDLIQRTITPTFWDTNGGPGSIFYYQPIMALVVSATSEVHENVGGLMEALRRASN